MGGIAAEEEMNMMNKPHVICMPFPAQGHVNPMMKLAKLLHYKGFHVTFVNTEFNHQRLLNSRGPDSLKGLPDFRFETIPDGLPPSDNPNATQDIPSLCFSTKKTCLEPFRNLLSKLNDTSASKVPPVTCIISDGMMSFTLKAAKELGIPQVLFWIFSFSTYVGCMQFSELVKRGLIPLKDESYLTNGFLDTPIDWVPGMKDIRFRDLSTFARTTDPNDPCVDFTIGESENSFDASALIFNTFDALEEDVLEGVKSQYKSVPPIYTTGPLHLLLNQISDKPLNSLGSNLWKEDSQCLKWLDSKEANSVVYINFGSIVVVTPQQLVEFAWGLANSNHTFLWIIRPDLVEGDSAILPSEFVAETKERGLLTSWCPQEDVLNHPSIAGFLTHCGWNSMLETFASGVPVICWPFFADQQMNCRYSCVHWGIGMEIDNNVKRDEVEKLVRVLMEEDKGKEMKRRSLEWKVKAEEAVAPSGSSYLNLDKIINEVLLSNNNRNTTI